MTITLLDLYNTAATQEWAMYDADALSDSEFENSLVLAINKAITQVFSGYDFSFTDRVHVILTLPCEAAYDLPNGLIKKDNKGKYLIRYNSRLLDYVDCSTELKPVCGFPEKFFIKNNKIVLYPIPKEKGMLTVEYKTLVIGETASGEEIYSLKNDDDILSVPAHLEELAKEAIITRTMLNTIASEKDENYSAYKKQAESAFNLLVKYSKGVEPEKRIEW